MSMRQTRTTWLVAATAGAALALAGCGDNGDDGAAATDGDAHHLEAGDMYFEPDALSAPAGEIEITLENVGGVEHDFVVEEAGDELVVHSDPGETNTGTIELEAGTYTFYCDVPGHREAGMEGTLEVS